MTINHPDSPTTYRIAPVKQILVSPYCVWPLCGHGIIGDGSSTLTRPIQSEWTSPCLAKEDHHRTPSDRFSPDNPETTWGWTKKVHRAGPPPRPSLVNNQRGHYVSSDPTTQPTSSPFPTSKCANPTPPHKKNHTNRTSNHFATTSQY
jgi:hypothetical protein